jgi:crossover junction endodeoxyribonuclease RuvC
MGIDPGLSRCGYAVISSGRAGPRAAALGVLTTPPASPLPARLAELQRELRALLAEFRPAAVAVERVLFQVNVRTAMSVGQASGVAMAEAAAAGCHVVEYSPNQVKDAVAGWGGAGKAQVQQMVQTLLHLPARPEPPDAADAAALALTHLAMADLAAVAEGPAVPVPGRPRNAVGRRPPVPGVPR